MPETSNDEIPTYTDVPVGIDIHGTRREFDSLGSVDVPANRYWGAQTQRSLIHFSNGPTSSKSAVPTSRTPFHSPSDRNGRVMRRS
jgi:hypothetical protein